MIRKTSIVINDVTYPVIIEYKAIRNSHYRYRDGIFLISSPYLVPMMLLLKNLKQFSPRLLKERTKKVPPYDIDQNFIYIFGERKEYTYPIDEKKLEKELKRMLLEYLTFRVSYFKEIMGVKTSYNIRVRKMKSRYGSNSRKTYTLSFSLNLVHYSPDIIDSVIIHELVHDKVFNHSKSFYNEIYTYCPNYKALKRKLDRGIYQ